MIAESPTWTTVYESPVGPLALTSDGTALTRLLYGSDRVDPGWQKNPDPFSNVIEQLDEFFAGTRRDFDIPLRPYGTAFQLRVWSALQGIPYGETRSYGQIALQIGNPTAVRAVGLANSRNPISIVVPCHRVIGVNGSLTGYAGGLANKRQLLQLEGASIVSAQPTLL
jgi:methylated-DNA-[protein]-cysteine S-methyltransferase